MSNETKILVCLALKKYKEDKQVSYQDIVNEIAAFSGKRLSPTTISNIINQKLVNDKDENVLSDQLMRTIKAFLKIDDWTVIDTDNFTMIQEVCEEAQNFSKFFGIVGPSQYGKTEALETYCRQHKNAFYLQANVFMTGKTSLLIAVCKSMGLLTGGRAQDMLDRVVAKMLTEKSLLIIDDAGKLSDTSFRILQLIYDRVRKHSGIVIAGTLYLKHVLENGITRNKMGYEELFRRVEYWLHLAELNGPEMHAICTNNGLDAEADKTIITFIVNGSNNIAQVRAKISLALRLKDANRLTVRTLTNLVANRHAITPPALNEAIEQSGKAA